MPKESKTKKKVVVDNEEIIDLEMQKETDKNGTKQCMGCLSRRQEKRSV